MSSTLFWEHKLVRDPLYGFIGLTAREHRLLDTFAVQRLTRIKQLAHTYIVYPSAVHTRLEHTIGTLNIASRICDQLAVKKQEKQAVRAAALLHDVGHGPYSHLFEEVMRYVNGDKFSHEDVTRLIVEHDTDVRRALAPLQGEVLRVLDGDSLLSDIISSSLDADKMDYLRRDSYHTGVSYGTFDLERILRTVCKIHEVERSYLGIEEKGREALESYRLARYSMHTQVYEHHARLIADDMFVRAVNTSITDGQFPREYFDTNDPEIFLSKYLELDDNSIEHYILQNSKGISRELIEQIRARKLLKRAFELPLTREKVPNPIRRERLIRMTKEEVQKAEEEITSMSGVNRGHLIVHLQSISIKLYEKFEQSLGRKEKPILIRNRDGSVSSLDEESPISASMTPIRRLFVFCPASDINNVRKAAEAVFQVKSIF